MTERKNYRLLEIIFPFVFGFDDTRMGFQEDSPLKHIHVLYTGTVNGLISNNYSGGWFADDVDAMRSSVWECKTNIWPLFGLHCENGLKYLKFHLDHLVDDLNRFGSVFVLNAYSYEHFSVVMKQSYERTLKSLKIWTAETVRRSDTALRIQTLYYIHGSPNSQQHIFSKTWSRAT